MSLKKRFFTVVLLVTCFLSQVDQAWALYSPTVTRKVATIKSHILSAQAKNGTGDLLELINTVKNNNRLRRQSGQVSGIPGQAKEAQNLILETNYNEVLQNPLSSLMMVFNVNPEGQNVISNCLRNDIWSLESLRDLVGQEMVRAYLLNDPLHGELLKADYLSLIDEIDLLKQKGANPYALIVGKDAAGQEVSMTSNEYFFGMPADSGNPINMYTRKFFHSDLTGCPDGEFERTFEQVVNSWKTLQTLGSGQGSFNRSAWGNIWSLAQANAKIRARQWIKANQITLTLGGEEGAQINSIIKGYYGWDAFVGNFKTELQQLKNVIGPVTPLFEVRKWLTTGANASGCVYYSPEQDRFLDCQVKQIEEQKQCKKDEEKAKAEGINCDRFKDLNQRRSLEDVANKQLNIIQNHENALEEATQTFVYSINLDSVSEQSLIQLDRSLQLMNATIQQGYEKYGVEGGGSIPSLTAEVRYVTQRQCQNKQ